MAEMVLRVTPETLISCTDDLSRTSQDLQKDLEHIRDLLLQIQNYVEGPGITDSVETAVEKANFSNDFYKKFSKDLEELSAKMVSMTRIYQAAESNFIESVKRLC